jgi:drug/metabolite transporter (DMT)-like permease
VAVVLGALGVLLISAAALAGPDAYGLSGALLALAASGGLAVGSVLAKRMGPQPRLIAVTAWQLILGSLPLLAAAGIVERDATVVWTGEFVGLLLFLGLAGTALPTPVWYWVLRHDDVGRLSIVLFLVPVFGLALAATVFGERLGAAEGLGVALAVAGAAVAGWEGRQVQPTGSPAAVPRTASATPVAGHLHS